jgi:cytidylate kinase
MSEATQVVAIDGPAGAGKSTAARRVAQVLGYSFLDTGAMYRAATWWAMHQGVDLDDAEALVRSTQKMDLRLEEVPEGLRVYVNGIDISAAIRTPEVTRLIFKLDQNSAVRRQLVELQRRFGEKQPTVAEGPDLGTVVFPKARCKIFLEASLDERTARRAKDLEAKGHPVDLDALRAEIHERDEKTRNRADSPLRPAEDAVILDTTNLTLDAVIDEIVRLAREKL